MLNNNIYNVDESIKKFITDENEQALKEISSEFKQGHFTNVLSKVNSYREEAKPNDGLSEQLNMIEAISHSQLGEPEKAANIIETLFEQKQSDESVVDDLLLYGQLAFLCDFKLTRKIMDHVRKQLEEQGETNSIRLARCYTVLGEAEENLQKFPRAIKYYKQSLSIMQDHEDQEKHTVLFLHYKLGFLHSVIQDTKHAIQYLQKAIELAEGYNEEVKINSMVSIAIMHGVQNEPEKAKAYLDEAIPLIEQSSLKNKLVHAEAHTEMAYYYFSKSMYDEAIPHYEKISEIYKKLPTYSARKLGMAYMQYAYSLEHKEKPEKQQAGNIYEKAIEQLEKTKDRELLQNALADVITFFDSTNNKRKKREYENKFVEIVNGLSNR